ncbi:lipase family protein [Candidatus Bathyarchaeota archaeon]|nr:lipase family protein [Candidatus Bathyarchaeota archaeon]
MRVLTILLSLSLLAPALADHTPAAPDAQERLSGNDTADKGVSIALFSSLERMSRLVDVAYCVGTSGVSKPFRCISRCKDFPSLSLVTTWNTGVLLGDSCGYIAVDHGVRRAGADGGDLREKAIIVAFRGTYSLSNTVVDLASMPQEYVPYPSPDEPKHECNNCTVHMGFLSSWRHARKEVLPHLKTLHQKHPDYPFHLVGHSLGGAVAALAALELKASLQWDDVTVTTFGEPRIGNAGLARFVEDVFGLDEGVEPEERRYRRVTHADDPVPLLPLAEWGFRPHAGEIFIGKAGLPPEPADLMFCVGADDARCLGGVDSGDGDGGWWGGLRFPARFRVWELLFGHRDYFWRLGLCVPGGDPHDWGREKYELGEPKSDEL